MINVRIINKCSRHVANAMDGMNFNLPLYFCLNCNNFASITTPSATLLQYQVYRDLRLITIGLNSHFECHVLLLMLRPCLLVPGLYQGDV
jgi:hypothetical protein